MRSARLMRVSLLCAAASATLLGCSQSSQLARPSDVAASGYSKAGAGESSVRFMSDSGPSPASPPSGASMQAPEPESLRRNEERAADRPGLGTVFGENRYSPVRDVEFERQSDSPMFLASLHYNDAQGIDAQRARLGSRLSSGEPVFRGSSSPAGGRARLWGGVTISVVDEGGRPLPAYRYGDHVLLVGDAGQRYAIDVENRTGQRFELVASIDGLDVVDGKSASLDKRGYVVSPHGRLRIEGYRRSMSEVAAFRFGSVRDSYAAQTAEFGAKNVGVIGVALFSERGVRVDYDSSPELDDEARRREQADPFPGRFANPPPRPYY